MSRYVDMPGHRGDISLGDVHILRSEFVVDLSDISHNTLFLCSNIFVGFIPAAASFMNFSLRDADEDW